MIRHRRTAVLGLAAVILVLLSGLVTAPAAYAHPLGNFSLNHYDGLRLSGDAVEDTAVVDSAEIPTAQDREEADADGDGTVSHEEAVSRARQRCARLAGTARLTVDGRRSKWRVSSSRLVYRRGAAGLSVARLTCRLHADADLSRPASVAFSSGADRDRTGWKEVTASAARGVRLAESSVPEASASAGLRRYPSTAADEPMNRASAHVRTRPGAGGPSVGKADALSAGPAAVLGLPSLFPGLERELTSLTTGRELTLSVGLLAVLLTFLLGAGHAVLPGHAKLAVAACLARRRGGVRAAVTVGATVTATHTAGVLAVGFVLTLSGGLLGDQLLRWLGAVSGVLVAVIGAGLAVTAVRALRRGGTSGAWHHGHHPTHDHGHHPTHDQGHHPTHAHEHRHTHGHDHGWSRPATAGSLPTLRLPSLLGAGFAGGLVPSPSALVVLLGAIALSRTSFGVLLVLGYGLGMAATLTAAGLLLSGGGSRLTAAAERRFPAWSRCTRYGTLLTALAILTVGLGLALRNLLP